MSIRLNGSTSGYTEIDAPAVAGSNTLVLPTGNGSAQQVLATNGSGALSWSNRPILQVVSVIKNDNFSDSSNATVDITGLSVSITPTSSSNKILVVATIGCAGTSGNGAITLRILRGSTVIAEPSAGTTSLPRNGMFNFYNNNQLGIGIGANLTFLDSPSTTSSTTYKVTGYTNSGTLYINRLPGDSTWNSVSTITVMEVAA